MNEGTIQHAACVGNLTALQEEEELTGDQGSDPSDITREDGYISFLMQEQTTAPEVAKTMSPIQPEFFPSLSTGRCFVEA